MFDPEILITDRLRKIDASGIRKVFDMAAALKDPINLSIGQPDFDVPAEVKKAAIAAIEGGQNRYTVTQGTKELNGKIRKLLTDEFDAWKTAEFGTLVTSGVSGGLLLALMTCVGPGDEVIIPDPYFVMYKHLVTLAGGTAVYVDTYPDFQVTAERVAPYVTKKTKMLLFNSPSNPTGVVASEKCAKTSRNWRMTRGFCCFPTRFMTSFAMKRPNAARDRGFISARRRRSIPRTRW